MDHLIIKLIIINEMYNDKLFIIIVVIFILEMMMNVTMKK